jgi:hypothetical protein
MTLLARYPGTLTALLTSMCRAYILPHCRAFSRPANFLFSKPPTPKPFLRLLPSRYPHLKPRRLPKPMILNLPLLVRPHQFKLPLHQPLTQSQALHARKQKHNMTYIVFLQQRGHQLENLEIRQILAQARPMARAELVDALSAPFKTPRRG